MYKIFSNGSGCTKMLYTWFKALIYMLGYFFLALYSPYSMGIWLHVETWMQCLFKDSDTGGTIAGKLMVIKFGGLPL